MNAPQEPPFGVNEMRLNAREWLITIAIVLTCAIAAPRLWHKAEPFPTGDDYRIPYVLSKDYWLYQRRLEQDATGEKIVILGDSVVWGEYVRPDGTLSHFLNDQAHAKGLFINGGVNGMFPLALEGLVNNYCKSLSHRRIIVQCNVLWMTSPKVDLSVDKEENFNHSRLVPQFYPRIPSYRADANERLSAVIEPHVDFFAWSTHLNTAYYDQKSIPQWTLEENESKPLRYPNGWKNLLAPVKSGIPTEPVDDPLRGPTSPRHKPWNADDAKPIGFDWVPLDASLQWQAFQRVIHILQSRGNNVLVIIGPFNEHMIVEEQRLEYHQMRERIRGKLAAQSVVAMVPPTLPSELYADASHPLTEGYASLAKWIYGEMSFRKWVSGGK